MIIVLQATFAPVIERQQKMVGGPFGHALALSAPLEVGEAEVNPQQDTRFRDIAHGHEVTLIVESTVRALTEIWSGDLLPDQALEQHQLRILGRPRDTRDIWRWIGTSGFAPTRLAAHTQ